MPNISTQVSNTRKAASLVSAVCIAISTVVPACLANEVVPTPQPGEATTAATHETPSVLNAANLSSTHEIIVNPGSTLILDVGGLTNGSLNIAGNITNNGTIYAVSSNQAITTAFVSANNIFNNQGSLFTTMLPTGGIPNFDMSSLVSNLNLTINALNTIINNGTISSAGNLSITAGTTINNTSVLSSVQNMNLQAVNIMNSGQIMSQLGSLTAATTTLTNSSIMQAMNGSVSIQNLLGSTLTVNNTLGSITARDSVLFETISGLVSSNSNIPALLDIKGGSITAASIGFSAAGGDVSVIAEHLNGAVNVAGCNAAVHALSGDLNLASVNLTDDPIFSANGNLNLGGLFSGSSTFNTKGGDFIALATRNITTTKGGTIDTTGAALNGVIVLAAG